MHQLPVFFLEYMPLKTQHFSPRELALMDGMLKKREKPKKIISALLRGRKRNKVAPPSKSAVYRYLSGETYQRDASETRGVSSIIGEREMKVYDSVRTKLLKEAENDYVVTWDDIAEEGQRGLRKRKLIKRSQCGLAPDTLRKRMNNELNVRKRPAPTHAVRTEDEEKRRKLQAQDWQKHKASFWQDGVHAYIDNKKFVMARTPAQRKQMRQSRVCYHLRKPEERTQPEFVIPKKKHTFTGIPAIEVAAAVAFDRIIMWHVVEGSWCGEAAATMYMALGKAMRRFWGKRRSYRVVEDGDPKGFQSGKGIEAKRKEKIDSLKLPPRTPEWMPLDFCLWNEIERRMIEDDDVEGTETKEQYFARLRHVALTLPRDLVKRCLLQMRERIVGTVASKGKHIAMD